MGNSTRAKLIPDTNQFHSDVHARANKATSDFYSSEMPCWASGQSCSSHLQNPYHVEFPTGPDHLGLFIASPASIVVTNGP